MYIKTIDTYKVGDKLEIMKNPIGLPKGEIGTILQILWQQENLLVQFYDAFKQCTVHELVSLENVNKYAFHKPVTSYEGWGTCICGNKGTPAGPGHSDWCGLKRRWEPSNPPDDKF